MKREEVERLYKELIIPESKQPYRFERREGSHVLAYNPVCGDKFKIYTDDDLYFYGHGCALSKASASLLIRQLETRSLQESKALIMKFISAVKSGETDQLNDDSLSILVALKIYDGREDCILLAWKAILEYLESK